MGIVRVSIYQKRLPDALNVTVLKKLAALKSDFLLFPEYFFADQSVRDLRAALDRSQVALDWLLKLSEAYRGVILGGLMSFQENGSRYCATPIIQGSQVIDWYRKRRLSQTETPLATPGDEPGVYILGGFRFSVLAGAEANSESYWKELNEQGMKLAFVLTSGPEFDADDAINRLLELSRQHGISIAICSGAGQSAGLQAGGRSMVLTPAGITWRTSQQERDMEILKTALINVSA